MLMDLDARRCYELLYLATQMRKARNEINTTDIRLNNVIERFFIYEL